MGRGLQGRPRPRSRGDLTSEYIRAVLGSLRFRLPALFLLGVVLSGVIASLIAVRFFQSYNKSRSTDELRAESVGIVQLYARQAGAQAVPRKNLKKAIGGDAVFWVPAFRGATLLQDIPQLPADTVDLGELRRRTSTTVDVSYKNKPYFAVARPLYLGNQLFGAVVV